MIIDSKGRVFGKVNVIDCAVIVFIVLCLVTMVPACFKITGEDRKAIEARISKDLYEKVSKEHSDELKEAREKVELKDKMADDMVKAQEVWYEGFRAGYAEGYKCRK
jgi:hypothetical protein